MKLKFNKKLLIFLLIAILILIISIIIILITNNVFVHDNREIIKWDNFTADTYKVNKYGWLIGDNIINEKYDENDNLSSVEYKNSLGKTVIDKFTYEYDSKNRLTKIACYPDSGAEGYSEELYGLLDNETIFGNQKAPDDEIIEIEYNANGTIKNEIVYSDYFKHRYDYEYYGENYVVTDWAIGQMPLIGGMDFNDYIEPQISWKIYVYFINVDDRKYCKQVEYDSNYERKSVKYFEVSNDTLKNPWAHMGTLPNSEYNSEDTYGNGNIAPTTFSPMLFRNPLIARDTIKKLKFYTRNYYYTELNTVDGNSQLDVIYKEELYEFLYNYDDQGRLIYYQKKCNNDVLNEEYYKFGRLNNNNIGGFEITKTSSDNGYTYQSRKREYIYDSNNMLSLFKRESNGENLTQTQYNTYKSEIGAYNNLVKDQTDYNQIIKQLDEKSKTLNIEQVTLDTGEKLDLSKGESLVTEDEYSLIYEH